MVRRRKVLGLVQYPAHRTNILGELEMTNWFECILDAAQLEAIYGNEIPSLHGVDFHGLDLHRDGPRALLRIDLSSYPKQPPKKWAAAGFNRVQLRLLAVGIHGFKMNGLQRNCKLAVGLIKENAMIRILGEGAGMSFELLAEHLTVDGISGYREEESKTN